MTKLSGRSLIALLIVQALMLPVAGAESADRPVAVPDLDLPPGYDWASRENATHLIADATPLYSFVQAHDVKTPYLDLEIKGLMPWRGYELSLGTIRRQVYTDGAGHGIAWNVFAENGMWTLTDHISGEPVTFLTIDATPEPDLTIPLSANVPCGYRWYCGPPRYQPPQPSSQDAPQEGMVIQQAAYSFTSGVRVQTSACWEHQTSVEAKASGGLAAQQGTAGGKLTSTKRECAQLSSLGKGVEYRQANRFRRDVYEDNSWKVYSLGESARFSLGEVDVNFQPYGNIEEWSVGPLSQPQTFSRTEKAAGAVYFGRGVTVFGIGLGVTFSKVGEEEDRVSIEFLPPGNANYQILFVSGDGASRGIVGMAWKES